MGNVAPRSAGAERIFADYKASRKQGAHKDDAVKQTVEARLGPLAPGMDAAEAGVAAAALTADDLETKLLAFDGSSDLEIGAVSDEIWNALGRPASSLEYTLIVGNGKAQ